MNPVWLKARKGSSHVDNAVVVYVALVAVPVEAQIDLTSAVTVRNLEIGGHAFGIGANRIAVHNGSAAEVEQKVVVPEDFTARYTQHGFLFNGKEVSALMQDFQRRFHVTDRPSSGYGTFFAPHVDRGHGFAAVLGGQGVLGLYKLTKTQGLRMMHAGHVSSVPEVSGMTRNRKWKHVSEKYHIDVIEDVDGSVVVQNVDLIQAPRDWNEYTRWFSEFLLSLPQTSNLRSLIGRYYARAHARSNDTSLPTPQALQQQVLDRMEADFADADGHTKIRYINHRIELGVSLTHQQIDWLAGYLKTVDDAHAREVIERILAKNKARSE